MKTLFGALMSMVVLAACTSPSVSQPEQASKAQVQNSTNGATYFSRQIGVLYAFNKFTEKELAGIDAYLDLSEMPKAYGKDGV